MKRRVCCILASLLCAGTLFAGGKKEAKSAGGTEREPVTILAAAAASLEYSFKEIIPLFEQKYPWITVEGTYDSSGRLQTQIEQGLEADVFMSAAAKQMNALVGEGLVDEASVTPMLENKIVLIRPAGKVTAVTGFENAAEAGTIALGDPASVPAGQYAQEVFQSLGNWDAVSAKASFGSNVTEVLNWVGEASADCGVVYATDAATTPKVEVIAEAPAGSLKTQVIYPAGIVASSKHKEAAALLLEFLSQDQAMPVFRAKGFAPAK